MDPVETTICGRKCWKRDVWRSSWRGWRRGWMSGIRVAVSLVLLSAAAWQGVAGAATYEATWTVVSSSASPGAPVYRGWTAMAWVDSLSRIVMWGGSGGVF